MELVFCQCGVLAPHARILDRDGIYSRAFFSQVTLLQSFAEERFFQAFPNDKTVPVKPEEKEEVFRLFNAQMVTGFPFLLHAIYDKLFRLVNVSELPVTDQEAWDALPEDVKAPVREFFIQGRWAPRGDEVHCNILTGLYAKPGYPGTLLR